ncbi:flagellar basal body-associated protein FliL [Paraferrimonas sedimenticola]|nr:flagellar basal body-associated protein FliL [Paraferrimonas sedimenticola]
MFSINTSANNSGTNDSDFAYYGLEPEIVTNYIRASNRMGYVRTSIELMAQSPSDLETLEHHDALIRATVVEILGAQTEEQIKSLEGREAIRQLCLTTINELLHHETGRQIVVNLLFTKYLYD